nr:MAG TPA: DNA topoisomerase 2 alpha [Caudoviricetes sp.]
MAKKEKKLDRSIWGQVDINEFENDDNIEDQDIGTYNLKKMSLFALNINCARQLPALEDSLKPVERRILYVMYQMGAYKGKKAKSSEILGACLRYHPHGDGSVYTTLCGMAQGFKRGQKLIRGIGNFGTIMDPSKCAHYRYTEAALSDYAYECFFEDYDQDCIEVKTAANMTNDEPVFIPGKFPNILVNGATSIAYGYNATIPPYNIQDIIDATKTLIKNPKAKNIVIIPDIPTGCDIVDTGSFPEICATGRGTLTMRSHIEIYDAGNNWVLKVSSIPWQSSLVKINQNILALAKSGEIPVKDVHDNSYPMKNPRDKSEIINVIDYELVIDKAYDPINVRNKLYKKAGLQKTVSVNFQVVQNGLQVRSYGLADLILQWIDTRREYLRRLYNKRYAKYNARMSLLNILIELTEKTNLQKTVKIIQSSDRDQVEANLVSIYGMNSFQAKRIADMPLRTFTKDAHDAYVKEAEDLHDKMEKLLEIVQSEKKIDKIIIDNLDDLKKYGTDRKCRIVNIDENNEAEISDTNHIMVFTKKGFVKKLPETSPGRTKTYGAFEAGDYPIKRLAINNRKMITIFDSNGKYSVMPVHEFTNTSHKDPGDRIFKIARLDGEVISAFESITDADAKYVRDTMHNDIFIMTITKKGLIKKTPIEEFNSYKTLKGIRGLKLKSDDALVTAFPLMSSTNIMIYTKMGNYTYLRGKDIPQMAKDTQGVMSVTLGPGDEVQGFCVVPEKSDFIVVLTAKGCMKKIPMESVGLSKSRRDSAYLTYLQNGDTVFQCEATTSKDKIWVCTKTNYNEFDLNQIPDGSRRSKCVKMVPVAVGDNIITMILAKS